MSINFFRLLSVFVLIVTGINALYAEYRAYLINVSFSKDKNKIFISTLDNIQFPSWFRGVKVENIELLDSWMCFGDTSGFKKPCDKPVLRGKDNGKDK